jgi:hypothetical protein
VVSITYFVVSHHVRAYRYCGWVKIKQKKSLLGQPPTTIIIIIIITPPSCAVQFMKGGDKAMIDRVSWYSRGRRAVSEISGKYYMLCVYMYARM